MEFFPSAGEELEHSSRSLSFGPLMQRSSTPSDCGADRAFRLGNYEQCYLLLPLQIPTVLGYSSTVVLT